MVMNRTRLPRRFDAVTKFLREYIADTRNLEKRRLDAAIRLADIYMEHDRRTERREVALAKKVEAETRDASTVQTMDTATTAVVESPEEAARRFLARINNGIATKTATGTEEDNNGD